MLANYHTHTWRCKHARGDDRAYVEDAICNGMQVLGFSDHCPWIYPDDFVSHTRMVPGQLDDYFTSLSRLRDEYAKDITIYIGFEAEYIPELMEEQDKLLAGYPIDYMILGEHFTQREPFGTYTGFVVDSEALLENYVSMVIEGMETGKYVYTAHPDLMGFKGEAEIYNKHYGRLCAYLKEHNIPIEINMLGVIEHRHYTGTRFLQLAGKVGCTAIIGCDAHSPDRLDNRAGQARCADMATKAGLPLLDFLPGLGPKHL